MWLRSFLVEAPLLWFFYPSEIGRLNEPFIFIAIGRTVIFLAVGYIVARMIGAQKQQRIELAAANDELLEHAATLEQLTINNERNRMARTTRHFGTFTECCFGAIRGSG